MAAATGSGGSVQSVASSGLFVQPASIQPGGSVLVEGSGLLDVSCGVHLFFGEASGSSLGIAPVTGGAFSTTITVPLDVQPGEHQIIALGQVMSGEFCTAASGEESRGSLVVVVSGDALDRDVALENRILRDPDIDEAFLAEIQSATVPVHGIVQLHRLPSTEGADLKNLQAMGIELLDYINGANGLGTAYLALLTPPISTDNPGFSEMVRALQRIQVDDKMPASILSMNDSDGPIDALVRFFGDVDPDRIREIFTRLKLEGVQQGSSANWEIQAMPSQLKLLAENDGVQWIQQAVPFMELLDEVGVTSSVDIVQDLNIATGVYDGRSGIGVQVAIMDTGVDDHHNDFSGRIIRSQDDAASHGSHVAGIAAGSGAQSDQTDNNGDPNGGSPFQWRGMAPEAGIAAYGGAGGNPAKYDDAINNFGVDVSNHSYVLAIHGEYDAGVATLDSIIRGDSTGIPPRPAVYAAGNNGVGTQYGVITGYFSAFSSCKNCLAVASINKNRIHSGFSSMGPTPDGRLKPEISAVGSSVQSVASDTHAGIGNGYRVTGGTSMAAPAVTGIVALMLEEYADSFSVDLDLNPPLPSTLKAVLLHTAIDLEGTDSSINPDTGVEVDYGAGPDWATGYGLAEAAAAVDLIRDQTFLEDQVSAGGHSDMHLFMVDQGETVNRVTLAWDDKPGTPNANDAAAQLVNDLDLVVIDPDGIEHQPLVLPLVVPVDCDGDATNGVQVGTCPGLDPAGQNYFGPATPGIDRRNNVEQVVIEDAAGLKPGAWTALVSVLNDDGVTVRLPLGGSQSYSLALDNNRPPVADAGPDQVLECESPAGSQLTLDGSGSYDPDDDALDFSWSGPFTEGGGTVAGVNPSVTMPIGANSVTLTVVDSRAAFDTDDVGIDVQDTVPPQINSVSVTPDALWPPNHKMVSVETEVDVTDICDDQVGCRIVSVSSNQPVNGIGDGNTEPDWEITGDLTLTLRAERSGAGGERVYTIAVECEDDGGNTSTDAVNVTVRHDQGVKS